MSRQWIIDGIGEAAFERLATELPGSELSSLLLEVMNQRAAARTPAEVLAQYRRDPFCAIAAIDQRTLVAIDHHILAAAERFEAIELSPVAPLATCSSVARTGQNRVLSALRGTEVVADPTNVLALECAARIRGGAAEVHLATSQRVIRTQPVPKLPGYSAHFRIFVMASGGIEAVDHAFTRSAMVRHLRTLHAVLDRLEQHGYAFGARRIELLATAERAVIADRIAAELAGLTVVRGALEHPYYSGGLRYKLWVTPRDGDAIPMIDGGAFDWLATLTHNRRAVYVTTGMGVQLVPILFRAA